MSGAPRPGHYRVIYADPPWSFATYSRKGKGRSPDAHYDCMDLDAIKRLPVAGWAHPDAVLLLWATDPLLDRALEVIQAWGFAYKTVGFYWAKLNKGTSAVASEADFFTGLGFWTRANPEPCLLATRGRPRRRSGGVRKLVLAPRREHSRKPDEMYERIEALLEGPYLELFARGSRPGWDAWGDQAGLFDGGSVATRRWASARPTDAEAVAGHPAEPVAAALQDGQDEAVDG
jgi:N6-adenosine-specific RNA methylase IME4